MKPPLAKKRKNKFYYKGALAPFLLGCFMKSFLEITKPVVDPGIYMCAKFDQASCEALKNVQKTLGITKNAVSAEKMHTTIVYSRKTVDVEKWDTKYGSTIVGILESEYLHSRFKDSIDAGATYDYPDYKPHVTLAYDSMLDDISGVKRLLTLPVDLTIIREEAESLDLDKSLKDITEHIEQRGDKWVVMNHDRTKELGEYDSKAAAEKRLRQIEYFKNQ